MRTAYFKSNQIRLKKKNKKLFNIQVYDYIPFLNHSLIIQQKKYYLKKSEFQF